LLPDILILVKMKIFKTGTVGLHTTLTKTSKTHPVFAAELCAVVPLPPSLTLLVGWQEGHPACKKTERWGAGMVICLERGADLHMAQLMPLPLTVSCFSKIQIGFTFLALAHLGSPGQRGVKRVCVCSIDRYILPSRCSALF